MLVYGDHCDLVCPHDRLVRIQGDIERIELMPAGMSRHAALQSVLIEAGRLEQGVADVDFSISGRDCRTRRRDALGRLTFSLASALLRSWRSGGAEVGQLPSVPHIADLPAELALKVPEGFAFYAVYPEAFGEAALELTLRAPPCVIGIRSIGTTLGAIVAAVLNAPPPITVRPTGDPFDRRVNLDPALEASLLASPSHFVIVDEGPGLSGSSFGAVADWLEGRGVRQDHIAFLPSHAGAPGKQALSRHRNRWERSQRVPADLGPRLYARVAGWIGDLLGTDVVEAKEISGGTWRDLRSTDDHRPAINAVWERRKFLLEAGGVQWLARFAGLGSEGERKLQISRALHGVGMVPEPAGLVNGLLVERWHDDAQPLRRDEKPLRELADYLGARARLLRVPRPGADLSKLLDMVRRNAGLALGPWVEERLSEWNPRLRPMQRRVVPVCIDGRMDRHEWLRLPDGRLLKCDSVDHHAAHDLIGCQDVAWDVAAAAVEFQLAPDEMRWLAAATGRAAGRLVDPELLTFLHLAYLAFRIGQASMSADMCSAPDRDRWQAQATRYAAELEVRLGREPDATRGIRLIDQQPERTGAGTILLRQG